MGVRGDRRSQLERLARLADGQLVSGAKPLTSRDVDQRVASALASQTPGPPFSSGVYQAIAPSLVLIQTHSTSPSDAGEGGLGSGVVVTDAGDILTALHVVENATDITLTFADGSTSPPKIVAQQPENDIAVIEADQPPATLVPATLGDPTCPSGARRTSSATRTACTAR